jgi:hypothetical protein
MASVSITASTNVSVQEISGPTSTTSPSTFDINSNSPVTGTALASPSTPLTVQIGISNKRGDPNRCRLTVSDCYGNQSFLGQASIDWDEADDSEVWVQFSEFPLQADQSSPMDKCNYEIVLSNKQSGSTEASCSVYTL